MYTCYDILIRLPHCQAFFSWHIFQQLLWKKTTYLQVIFHSQNESFRLPSFVMFRLSKLAGFVWGKLTLWRTAKNTWKWMVGILLVVSFWGPTYFHGLLAVSFREACQSQIVWAPIPHWGISLPATSATKICSQQPAPHRNFTRLKHAERFHIDMTPTGFTCWSLNG